jgi:hypothetical protein
MLAFIVFQDFQASVKLDYGYSEQLRFFVCFFNNLLFFLLLHFDFQNGALKDVWSNQFESVNRMRCSDGKVGSHDDLISNDLITQNLLNCKLYLKPIWLTILIATIV